MLHKMKGNVVSVSRDGEHRFFKEVCSRIMLLENLGVEGDAHSGITVQHLSRVAADPSQPNLRQVHLIHSELFEELEQKGFSLSPGNLGENILTAGIDLLALPQNAVLRMGESARVRVTGLRNPCGQIDHFKKGLLEALLDEDEDGRLIRKARIMGVVLAGGLVSPGDEIEVELPPQPHFRLERV